MRVVLLKHSYSFARAKTMSSGGEELATDLNADGKRAQKKKKAAPSLFSAGDLVWAKVSGFKFWAGKVSTIHIKYLQ